MHNPFSSSSEGGGAQAAHQLHLGALDQDHHQPEQQEQRMQQEQEQQLMQLSELQAPQYHHQQQQAFQLTLPVPRWSDLNDADNNSLSSGTSTGKDGGCNSNSSVGGGNVDGIPGHDGGGTGGHSSSCSSSSSCRGAAERRTKKRNLSNPQTSRWLTCQVCRLSKTKWYVDGMD